MFLKYDICQHVKTHILPREVQTCFHVYKNARKVLKMPSDILSYPLGSMLCGETYTRPEQAANSFRQIIMTPNSELDEEEKFRRLLYLVQDI
jgi:hypothetical protein